MVAITIYIIYILNYILNCIIKFLLFQILEIYLIRLFYRKSNQILNNYCIVEHINKFYN